MNKFLDKIKNGNILVADGAMGTFLFERGLKPGDCPEALNLSNPEKLEEIAQIYLDAGAEIIQTNTFGASTMKLAQYGLSEKTTEINIAAVRAVRKVVGENAFVSASCGPSGKILKPYGDAEPDELYAGFQKQLTALIGEGVDIICVETMTDINEACLAIKAAKSISTEIPVMATMTFDSIPRGFYTIMGVDIKTAAEELAAAGADLIGSNCGNGIDNMIKIAAKFKEFSDKPIIIQSNAGLPKRKSGKFIYDETPEYMVERLDELIKSGVSVIGGCCGTGPEHIAAFRKYVDGLKKKKTSRRERGEHREKYKIINCRDRS